MEVGVLRRMLKRAKVWTVVAEDVRMLPERGKPIGRVLTSEEKRLLFQTAARPEWQVAFCAAVLAASTTSRGVELKNLRWKEVDLFGKSVTIYRSKTEAGHRTIPLTRDAMTALSRLAERAQALGAFDPERYIFPACENGQIDASRPQKSWRTAWRRLVRETERNAGRTAAEAVLRAGLGIGPARREWKRAAAAFKKFRFHDLRHQAITELAEGGASEATMMALAGHMFPQMLEHYSHVRMEAKRSALEGLEGGMIAPPEFKKGQTETGPVH